MSKLRSLFSLFVLFVLLTPLSLHAMNGIIWQPHDKDLAIPDVKWQALMHDVRKEDFDTFVVQWTRYGDSFSTKESQKQLQEKIAAARKAGLKLIIGLYMDPEFFELQQQPAVALDNYLNRLRVLDVAQVKLWQTLLQTEPEGWYISAEIDDLNWRDSAMRTLMLIWLTNTRHQIKQYSKQPVYISSFFTGQMTPASYGGLLTEMQAVGLKVWLQDGSGVNRLTAKQRDLYLSNTAASGIIYELFTMQASETFSASAKSAVELKSLFAHRPNYPDERLYFSLRYLPISAGVLEIDASE